MMTIASIVSILSMVASNASAFEALGVDLADIFAKGKALVSTDTASTPAERADALVAIEALQDERDAALAVLAQKAPGS